MELPNEHFQNFPIEFKEINPDEFRSVGFDVQDKVIIEPNNDGYIFDALKDTISISEKNTVVVNAPVGYGKSYAIIKLIKAIYKIEPKSKIIVATPFVSLVEQYVNEIQEVAQISENEIYSYSHLGRHKKPSYKDKRVHVVTVNTLLGNPGEDSFKNSDAKRLYLNYIVEECIANDSKTFFIYDEIHDAIQNFKEEFIPYLWKWKDVIHKNIILSATYNEASKVVIKYLAELTDMKIQIIESVRKRFPEKQSELYLHYSADYNFSSTTDELVNIVDDLLKRNRNIDILSYSKSLAKSIIKDREGIGKKLTSRFGKLNDCTSQLITNQRLENEAPKNRYNNGLCNVGTNFKTGVNIKKENHSFIIILPPRATRMWFKNMYGIFSSGIISIIQALARQRTKGEIHIILPRPDEFDISSLKKANINDLQIRVFEDFYSKVKHHTLDEEEKKVQYLPLTVQDNLLYNFYHKDLEGFLKDEIYTIAKKEKNKEREELPRLTFPPYEIWKLHRGEQYLANTYKFFGDDISAYVTYCAFTNQFINCNLTGINYKSTLLFEEGKMQKKLYTYFDKYFGEDYLEMEHTYSNFSMFYNKLRNEFINNFQLKFKKSGSKEYDNIKPYSNKIFEIQFILFTHKLYQGYNIKEQPQNDIEYSRSQYLLDCISTSNSINLENSEYTEQQTRRIQAFQYLGLLRDRLIQSVSESNNKPKFQYLPLVPPVDFIKPDETKILNDILKIIIEAPLFKNDIFSLRRNFERKSNLESKIKSLYKILVDDFFKVEDFTNYPQVVINGKRRNVKPIIEPIMLPRADTAINLVMLSDLDQDFIKMIEEYILQIPKSKSDTSPKYKDSEEYYSEISKLLE